MTDPSIVVLGGLFVDSAVPRPGAELPKDDLDAAVIAIVAHARYRGGYVPVWRILDAAGLPARPAAVHGALRRLEDKGCDSLLIRAG